MSRSEIVRVLLTLRGALDDMDAVTADQLQPLHRRELGPVLARRNYRDAKKSAYQSLDFLTRHFSDPEPGDASRVQ